MRLKIKDSEDQDPKIINYLEGMVGTILLALMNEDSAKVVWPELKSLVAKAENFTGKPVFDHGDDEFIEDDIIFPPAHPLKDRVHLPGLETVEPEKTPASKKTVRINLPGNPPMPQKS
jgi:hypothetical protein